MTARLPTRTLVSALIRRVDQAGGFATVLAKGEEMGGTILIQTAERGRFSGFFERMIDFDGKASLVSCGPPPGSDPAKITEYGERRLRNDRDLWWVELDIADAERFAAETIAVS